MHISTTPDVRPRHSPRAVADHPPRPPATSKKLPGYSIMGRVINHSAKPPPLFCVYVTSARAYLQCSRPHSIPLPLHRSRIRKRVEGLWSLSSRYITVHTVACRSSGTYAIGLKMISDARLLKDFPR